MGAPRHSKRPLRKPNHWKWVPLELPIFTLIYMTLVLFIILINYVSGLSTIRKLAPPYFFLAAGIVILIIHSVEAVAVYFMSKRLSEDDQAAWTIQAFLLGVPTLFVFQSATRRRIPVKNQID